MRYQLHNIIHVGNTVIKRQTFTDCFSSFFFYSPPSRSQHVWQLEAAEERASERCQFGVRLLVVEVFELRLVENRIRIHLFAVHYLFQDSGFVRSAVFCFFCLLRSRRCRAPPRARSSRCRGSLRTRSTCSIGLLLSSRTSISLLLSSIPCRAPCLCRHNSSVVGRLSSSSMCMCMCMCWLS